MWGLLTKNRQLQPMGNCQFRALTWAELFKEQSVLTYYLPSGISLDGNQVYYILNGLFKVALISTQQFCISFFPLGPFGMQIELSIPMTGGPFEVEPL